MEDKIFSVTDHNFEALALEIFHFQYEFNLVYQAWVDTLGIDPNQVESIQQIPFLPISFLRHEMSLLHLNQPRFESSGTTGTTPSRHFVKSLDLYRKSFLLGFNIFTEAPNNTPSSASCLLISNGKTLL
jgi:phenylacetate-coenzyme A ligase PaaK-like adenylate-forming protein